MIGLIVTFWTAPTTVLLGAQGEGRVVARQGHAQAGHLGGQGGVADGVQGDVGGRGRAGGHQGRGVEGVLKLALLDAGAAQIDQAERQDGDGDQQQRELHGDGSALVVAKARRKAFPHGHEQGPAPQRSDIIARDGERAANDDGESPHSEIRRPARIRARDAAPFWKNGRRLLYPRLDPENLLPRTAP
jgi:hypothetical protein